MKFATALLLMLTLSACSQGAFNSGILPDVREYTPAVQKQAAAEVKSGSCPVLGNIFMPDYGVMRDQTRAAKKILPK